MAISRPPRCFQGLEEDNGGYTTPANAAPTKVHFECANDKSYLRYDEEVTNQVTKSKDRLGYCNCLRAG